MRGPVRSASIVTVALGVIVTLASATILAGWFTGTPGLAALMPGLGSVRFSTALGLLFVGLGLAAAGLGRGLVVRNCGALAMVIPTLVFLGALGGPRLAPGAMFARALPDLAGKVSPSSEPPVAAAVILLIVGLALFLLASGPRRARAVAWLGGTGAVLVGASVVLRAGHPVASPGSRTHIAPASLLLLTLTCVALQAAIAPTAGAVHALWVDRSVRASLLRRFALVMPLLVAAPLLTITLILERQQLTASGTRLVAQLGSATILALIFMGAAVGYRLAEGVSRRLRAIRDQAERLEHGDDEPASVDSGRDEIADLSHSVDALREATRKRRSIESLVSEAARAASNEPDLESAFASFAAVVRRVVNFDRASMGVREDETFVYMATTGPRRALLPPGTVVPLGTHLREAFASFRTLVEPNTADHPEDETSRTLLADGLRSFVSVPLVVAGRAEGMVSFSWLEPGAFSTGDAPLLEAVVREASGVFTQLMLLERERMAIERLRELDGLKNDFVAMVAHDLRSPMAVISGFAEIMRDRWDEIAEDKKLQFLDVILRNTLSLSRLVEDILEVTRLESGQLSFKNEKLDMGIMLSSTLEDLRAAHPGRAIRLEVPPDLPNVVADQARQGQVVHNLVSNALKFSPRQSLVDVMVSHEGTHLRVSVADRGIGIDPHDQDRLFRKFSRLTAGTDHEIKGTGLGLYISRSIVEAQGGTITVESTLGAGSTFSYTIPIAGPSEGSMSLAGLEKADGYGPTPGSAV